MIFGGCLSVDAESPVMIGIQAPNGLNDFIDGFLCMMVFEYFDVHFAAVAASEILGIPDFGMVRIITFNEASENPDDEHLLHAVCGNRIS